MKKKKVLFCSYELFATPSAAQAKLLIFCIKNVHPCNVCIINKIDPYWIAQMHRLVWICNIHICNKILFLLVGTVIVSVYYDSACN